MLRVQCQLQVTIITVGIDVHLFPVDKGKTLDVVSPDFSKTFDKDFHVILLGKLAVHSLDRSSVHLLECLLKVSLSLHLVLEEKRLLVAHH